MPAADSQDGKLRFLQDEPGQGDVEPVPPEGHQFLRRLGMAAVMRRLVIIPADKQESFQEGQDGPYPPVVFAGGDADRDAARGGDGVHVIQRDVQTAGGSREGAAFQRHVQADHRRPRHGPHHLRFSHR